MERETSKEVLFASGVLTSEDQQEMQPQENDDNSNETNDVDGDDKGRQRPIRQVVYLNLRTYTVLAGCWQLLLWSTRTRGVKNHKLLETVLEVWGRDWPTMLLSNDSFFLSLRTSFVL